MVRTSLVRVLRIQPGRGRHRMEARPVIKERKSSSWVDQEVPWRNTRIIRLPLPSTPRLQSRENRLTRPA